MTTSAIETDRAVADESSFKCEEYGCAQSLYVLLAERDDAVREVTTKVLQATSHFVVIEVSSVEEALKQMAKVTFAAVLLDPLVDGMGEMKAVERLYLAADAAQCPVIAFSDVPRGDLGLVYPFGFAGVVSKPFGALDLGERVSAICMEFVSG